ncbi:erythromycin esterase family protein [Streptococcus ovis]|uniref:erythromycin esterase family protein n=1 Tax=Streptococcus ovis TaxID=82806 RepID=UPI00035CB806|nr:erythromycin esterase family protein [Streptococcus ovis]
MKWFKKVIKIVGVVLLSIVALVCLADVAWVYGPQLVASKKVGDVDQYAQAVTDITLPKEVKVVGLGEASHGNVEFQELKLSVLQTLVKKEGVRSFALEADAAEGVLIDRYIKGGEGTAEELVKQFSFTIYRTKQMAELIKWMREYNAGKPDKEQLSFYGFDMQNPEKGVDLVLDDERSHGGEDLTELEQALQVFQSTSKWTDEGLTQADRALQKLEKQLVQEERDRDFQVIHYVVQAMRQACQYYLKDSSDYVVMNTMRDEAMAKNVEWIQTVEEAKGHPRILIAGHNGHVAYKTNFYPSMGRHLREAYADAYFVIGSDYFETTVNINAVGQDAGRSNQHFNSADPLAAQAKRFGGDYYLDFSKVTAGSETDKLLSAPMSMGSLGEGYSFLMHLLPSSHRIKEVPRTLYDAMIFVEKAEPIKPMKKQ